MVKRSHNAINVDSAVRQMLVDGGFQWEDEFLAIQNQTHTLELTLFDAFVMSRPSVISFTPRAGQILDLRIGLRRT